jgi:hypothetical protein
MVLAAMRPRRPVCISNARARPGAQASNVIANDGTSIVNVDNDSRWFDSKGQKIRTDRTSSRVFNEERHMPANSNNARPLRAGVFEAVAEADKAVEELLAAGFGKDQITVICSVEAVQRHFKQYEHQDPAGKHAPAAALTGGVIGATLGGLAAVAGFVTTGGVALFVGGGLAIWTGGVVGGLVGAMMTRGVEKELANFYDQEVGRGKILVAVEEKDPARQALLARASEIFARHGVEPLPLSEG